VVCLRRAGEGALLQCVVAHDTAIDELAPLPGAAAGLRSRARGEARGWALPSLAGRAAGDPPAPPRWGGRAVRAEGHRVLGEEAGGWREIARMRGRVQALAASPAGVLAIAAWIGGLEDPSVVLVPGDTMEP
jgi:hypothetical protein